MYLVIYCIIGIIAASGMYIWLTWDMSPSVRERDVDSETVLLVLFCIFVWPIVIPVIIIIILAFFLIEGLNYLIDKYIRK